MIKKEEIRKAFDEFSIVTCQAIASAKYCPKIKIGGKE